MELTLATPAANDGNMRSNWSTATPSLMRGAAEAYFNSAAAHHMTLRHNTPEPCNPLTSPRHRPFT
jgi:hypothetical protein